MILWLLMLVLVLLWGRRGVLMLQGQRRHGVTSIYRLRLRLGLRLVLVLAPAAAGLLSVVHHRPILTHTHTTSASATSVC
jgi:hypothetical protein